MQLLLVPILVLAIISVDNVSAASDNCDEHGILLYEDMACEPKYEGTKCPSQFVCNLKSSNNEECVVQNKSYAINTRIEKNSVGLSCEFGCFCSRRYDKPYVACAVGSCGTWGRPPPTGCYWTFNLKQCCSNGKNCEPEENIHKCLVDGTEYKEGERFAPKNSCHVCLCQKGFDGEYKAPFCKRRACDVQLRNQGDVNKSCAPIYVPDNNLSEGVLCCPSLWTCPDGTETFKGGEQKIDSDSDDKTCKYGEKSLKLGDSFTKQTTYRYKPLNVQCECKIPPLLTCVGK